MMPRCGLTVVALLVLSLVTTPQSSLRAETVPQTNLASINAWLLLLNNPLEDDVISRIQRSAHDMVVVDFLSSIIGRETMPMRDIVQRLRERHDAVGKPPRLVVAYLNVGQAEDYRTYWQPGWRAGAPSFIIGDDPDGWAGNFPVTYWDPAWKAIITGEGGLIDAIAAAGFDGLYLDWIGGYSYEPVVARAQAQGIDAEREMIRFVGEVSARMKARRQGAIIIAQNAPELWMDASFLAVIDAVVQEHTWFGGTEGNEMTGDCPLPRNMAEAQGSDAAYLASLPELCLREWRSNPDSSLHYESESYLLPFFAEAQNAGKTVLTVDYALEDRNVVWVAAESRRHGFKPFVGSRLLTDFAEPAP